MKANTSHRALGNHAETIATWWLRLKGYRILARQYALHHAGEVDIVARKRDVIVFVEVKARATHDAALFAVNVQKSIRMQKAAGFFMAKHPQYAHFGMRYDIIAIAPKRWPLHIEDAFRPRY